MKCISIISLCVLICAFVYVPEVSGHGMMLEPPGRSSRWRSDNSAPANYEDNELNCGGFGVQWHQHGGKCGLCGDNYGSPAPRPNELGGRFGGSGVITKVYRNTYTATLGVRITANHLGYFQFRLCNLDAFHAESDECFNQHLLRFADGSDRLYIGSTMGWIEAVVVLPEGLSCDHCVLKWIYRGGNNWGTCDDGTQGTGCGPQENFLSCADVSIYAPARQVDLPELQPEVPARDAEQEYE